MASRIPFAVFFFFSFLFSFVVSFRPLRANKYTLQIQGTNTEELSNVVLYDGICNFCNGWVDLLMKMDSKKKFKFCSLQSPQGKTILSMVGKDSNDISSVVLVKSLVKNEIFFKSEVVIEVLKQLGYSEAFVALLAKRFVPAFFRDSMYDFVAERRYLFMGKRDECRIADDQNPDRFL